MSNPGLGGEVCKNREDEFQPHRLMGEMDQGADDEKGISHFNLAGFVGAFGRVARTIYLLVHSSSLPNLLHLHESYLSKNLSGQP
jgi:hypothetical protein